MKECKRCEQLLSYDDFYKSKQIKDGYENTCKKCRQLSRKRYKKTCKICQTDFKTARKETQFCGVDCQGIARRRRTIKKCSFCNGSIEVINSKADNHDYYYCNQDCRTRHLKTLMLDKNNPNYNRVEYHCDGCSKQIKVIPSRIEKQKYIFCTSKCYQNNIGKYFTGELNTNYNHQEYNCAECGDLFIRKPSQNRGERVFCSQKCYLSSLSNLEIKAMIDVKCPICDKKTKVWRSRMNYSTRIYCSRECANKGQTIYYSGENSPNWNHNLSKEERVQARKYDDYYSWRKGVFKRDKFTCQCCGDDSGGNLVSHHILNYSEHPELRIEISNGITLCESCHKDFHDTYGYTNNNQLQLNEFIDNFKKASTP